MSFVLWEVNFRKVECVITLLNIGNKKMAKENEKGLIKNQESVCTKGQQCCSFNKYIFFFS